MRIKQRKKEKLGDKLTPKQASFLAKVLRRQQAQGPDPTTQSISREAQSFIDSLNEEADAQATHVGSKFGHPAFRVSFLHRWRPSKEHQRRLD